MSEEKTVSQQLLEKATKEGKASVPFLRLAIQVKDDDGKKKGVKGTGKHIVKFISDKAVEIENYKTKEKEKGVEYLFEEDGQQKRYQNPIYNENGELHYFVARMAEVQKGETITLEYKKIEGSFKGYNSVERTVGGEVKEEIPVIQQDEEEINLDIP